jgi:uncharacterized SAM-binding protein YcdF (DUF218 family)
MFFILSKVLSLFVNPFTWILIFIFIAFFTKRERLKKWTKVGAIFCLLFFTNTVVFLEFTRMWESRGTKMEDVGHYDVGLVLGGMAEFDNNHERLSLRRGGDRIWQAVHLYSIGKIDKIMLIGANGDVIDKGLNEAIQFRDVLLDFGIPLEDIIIEAHSKNTHQNAVEAKKVLKAHPELKSMLLITSALHMKRAEACFKKAGFDHFNTFTTDHFTGPKRGYSLEQFFVPNASNMVDWSRLIHEMVGYLTYRMMGYI